MGLLARIAANPGGQPMDPALYEGLDLLGPEVVAQAQALAAKLPPGLRAELGALLVAVDNASHMRTGRRYDYEMEQAIRHFGISPDAWWAMVDKVGPTPDAS